MPHAVMYSPPHMCGYSFPCFQITQDQKGLLSMLQHLRWNKMVGNDMLVVLSAIQFLKDVKTKLSHLGDGWFMLHRK